jgi:hypothetical protein
MGITGFIKLLQQQTKQLDLTVDSNNGNWLSTGTITA